jgi:pantoate--beta-alanine ligase
MEILRTVVELREYVFSLKISEKTIGFVPTMGFLHDGHSSLIERSKKENDITIVSIYVNPIQFNNPSDYEKYPKNEELDIQLLNKLEVDILFLPITSDIFGSIQDSKIEIKIPNLMKNLCAPSRPGHFEGVLHIVSKLFNYTLPNRAYFGLKDYQQYLIIKELVNNLSFPIQIIGMETIREKNGLAMSSRNSRLSPEDIEDATLIYRSMSMAKDYVNKKNISINIIKEFIKEILLSSKNIKIDYLEILDPFTLVEKEELTGNILIAIAIFIKEVRLIDNIRFEV